MRRCMQFRLLRRLRVCLFRRMRGGMYLLRRELYKQLLFRLLIRLLRLFRLRFNLQRRLLFDLHRDLRR